MTSSRDIDIAKMNSLWWYHKIDLGGGVITPGLNFERMWDHVSRFLDDIDFTNKTVLDIGCWDGKWTFDAEHRGAKQVVATDDLSQRGRGGEDPFRFAHSALGSKAIYHPNTNVYNVDQLSEGPFDIVLFLGVLYHLRYPQFAIAKIRQVLKEGGILVIETSCVEDSNRSYIDFQLGHEYTIYNDPTTWCEPSLLCLKQSLQTSYFAVRRQAVLTDRPSSQSRGVRGILRRLVHRPQPFNRGRVLMEGQAKVWGDVRHPFPDPFLGQFDTRFRIGESKTVNDKRIP